MPQEANNGIIRWQHLTTTMDTIRHEFREEITKVEEGQQRNAEQITHLRTQVASLKTEMRILGAILLSLLLSIIGLILNHISTTPPP